MSTLDLISRARAAGIELSRNGDKLRYKGPPEAVSALLPDLRTHKAELLAVLGDPVAEDRRARVLAALEANPDATIAALTDAEAMPGHVLVSLAIRSRGTCELLIPIEKWDGVLFLDLLERHGRTMH